MAKNKTENTAPARLAEGEPLIPKELAEKYLKSIEELKEKQNSLISSNLKESKNSSKDTALKTEEESNIIGTSGKVSKPSAKAGPKKTTVAIYSERNVSWIGVGKITKGYNIVTKEQANRWLTRDHVREATPEEVASQFGA
jgi:hypothetical protein